MAKLKLLQNPFELEWFIDVLRKENVRSFLEVGSQFGGSLLRIGQSLEVPSRIVSVDLAEAGSKPDLDWCIAELNRMGHSATLVPGDSTDKQVVEKVRNLGPFDACFIDANHTLPFLWNDWLEYGPMCRLVAFHDIGWKPKEGAAQVDVPEFWNVLKQIHRHDEVNLNVRKNGIGVLWRW